MKFEAISQIKSKFDFTDEIYNFVSIVDPKVTQSFQTKSLSIFQKRFPDLQINSQNLDNEWREHALLDFKKFELFDILDPQISWIMVVKL